MTGATHLSALTLVMLSLLFGGGLSIMRECVRGALSLFRLLPPPVAYRSPFPKLLRRGAPISKKEHTPESEEKRSRRGKDELKEKEKRKRGLPPHFFGYLFFDLVFFLSFAVCYLIFLFVFNEGIVRGYSLLCVLFGFLFCRKTAHRMLAIPLFRLGSFFFSLLAFLLSFLMLPVILGARRLIVRKKEKKNLTKNEKCSIVKGMKKSKERL